MSSLADHLRNTVTGLDLPIFVELDGDQCRTPLNLALGDTLMLLGIIRNQGRPVRLHCSTKYREVFEGHPLIKELVEEPQPLQKLKVRQVKAKSSGRDSSWVSYTTYHHSLPPSAIDEVRANHVLSHSLYYSLPRQNDRPGIHLDRSRNSPLAGLLSSKRPTLIIYCQNPGRNECLWYDEQWWLELANRLRKNFCLVAVGGREYGQLEGFCDAALSMDDPDSTILNLAWLFDRASGFIGRDGGLCHLAQAAGANSVVVWDSMLSYRFWSSSHCRHLVFSNPFSFRYPETLRLNARGIAGYVGSLSQEALAGVAASLGISSAAEILPDDLTALGSTEATALGMAIQQNEEREAIRSWLENEHFRQKVYEQSLDFAQGAVMGRRDIGQNWIVPVSPRILRGVLR